MKTNFEKIKEMNEKELALFIESLCEMSFKTNMKLFAYDTSEKLPDLEESYYSSSFELIERWLKTRKTGIIEDLLD